MNNKQETFDRLEKKAKEYFRKWGITTEQVKVFSVSEEVYSNDKLVAGSYNPLTKKMAVSTVGMANYIIGCQKNGIDGELSGDEAFLLILAHEVSHALDPILNAEPLRSKNEYTRTDSDVFYAELYAVGKTPFLLKHVALYLIQISRACDHLQMDTYCKNAEDKELVKIILSENMEESILERLRQKLK